MATAMMTAFPSMEPRPIDVRNNGTSETVSASVVSLDHYRCQSSGNAAFAGNAAFVRIGKLEANWDGHGANPPCRHSIEVAQRFWLRLRKSNDMPSPDVMATPEGGVYLEWDTPTAVLMVEFRPDGEADIFAKTSDFDVDGRFKDYVKEFWQTVFAL